MIRRTGGVGKGATSGSEPEFETILRLFRGDRRVIQGRMFDAQVMKLNGKVFAMLVKGKLVLKLPNERVAALVGSHIGEYFDPGHGRLMKGWIALGSPTKAQWSTLAKEARDFIVLGQLGGSRSKGRT